MTPQDTQMMHDLGYTVIMTFGSIMWVAFSVMIAETLADKFTWFRVELEFAFIMALSPALIFGLYLITR